MEMFQKVPNGKGFNKIDSSGMKLLNFHKIVLGPGESYTGNTVEHEVLFDILGGKATFTVNGKNMGILGGRPNPFAGKGYSLYAPFKSEYTVTTESGPCEIAVTVYSDLKGA